MRPGQDNHRNVFHYIAMMTVFWERDLDSSNYVKNKLNNLNQIKNYIINDILIQESIIETISTKVEMQDFRSASNYFEAARLHFTSIQDDYGFKPADYIQKGKK